MYFYRPWTRHVHLCWHKFEQRNHTTTCRVRPFGGIPVIRSRNHGYTVSVTTFSRPLNHITGCQLSPLVLSHWEAKHRETKKVIHGSSQNCIQAKLILNPRILRHIKVSDTSRGDCHGLSNPVTVVYYETIKRKINRRLICDKEWYQPWYVDLIIRINPFRLVFWSITDSW